MKFFILTAFGAMVACRHIVHDQNNNKIGPEKGAFHKWLMEQGKEAHHNNNPTPSHAASTGDGDGSDDDGGVPIAVQNSTYPLASKHQGSVHELFTHLSTKTMERNLKHLTEFYTREYESQHGGDVSAWLYGRLEQLIDAAYATNFNSTVHLRTFPHPWEQQTVIATIVGRSEDTLVLGAHQGSSNRWSTQFVGPTRAPGADDDASGLVVVLEAFRVLLADDRVRAGNADMTMEFHLYSSGENNQAGSRSVFRTYRKHKRSIRAMLQQDMTGYIRGTLDAEKPECIGLLTDNTNYALTKYIEMIIEQYLDIPWIETRCEYDCSDHVSATRFGYPAACAMESAWEDRNPYVNSIDDVTKHLSFDHMLRHAKMTVAMAYELAFKDSAPVLPDEYFTADPPDKNRPTSQDSA